MSLTFTSEVDIQAKPDAFFAAFRDISAWGGWMQGLVSIEVLTTGAFGAGTQWRETRKMFGREASEVFEVTAWEPPRAVALFVDGRKGRTGKGEFRFRYAVEPRAGGVTHVRMQGEVDMPGWFARLMARLFLGSFRKACERDLQALKAYLERAARA
jgi:uncharacterized membrane protein